MKPLPRTSLLACLLVGLVACAPASPTRGTWQGDGTAAATFDAHSDGAEPFEVEVDFPARADGTPRAGWFPGAVLVAERGVAPGAYRWLARALAQQGYVVALPELPGDDPSDDRQRAEVARALLRSDRGLLKDLVTERIAVLGHGAGGAAALNQAINGQFDAVVLLAADPDRDAAQRIRVPSLLVHGLADCTLRRSQLEADWVALPAPSVLVELGDVSHAQFTDSEAADLVGCPPGIGLDAAHAEIASAVKLFLDFALREDANALPALKQSGFDVTVEAR